MERFLGKNEEEGILKDGVYRKKYKYYKNIYLTAIVEEKGGQKLEISVEDRKGRVIDATYINCIHTAVADVSYEYFEELKEDQDAQKDFLIAVSTENRTEIKLSFKDRIFAFTSWVEGICALGINSLIIQSEIEKLAKFAYPIINVLFKFILRYRPEFLEEFLIMIDQNCRINGQYHIPSLIANLEVVKNILGLNDQNQFDMEAENDLPFELIGMGEHMEERERINRIIRRGYNEDGFDEGGDSFEGFGENIDGLDDDEFYDEFFEYNNSIFSSLLTNFKTDNRGLEEKDIGEWTLNINNDQYLRLKELIRVLDIFKHISILKEILSDLNLTHYNLKNIYEIINNYRNLERKFKKNQVNAGHNNGNRLGKLNSNEEILLILHNLKRDINGKLKLVLSNAINALNLQNHNRNINKNEKNKENQAKDKDNERSATSETSEMSNHVKIYFSKFLSGRYRRIKRFLELIAKFDFPIEALISFIMEIPEYIIYLIDHPEFNKLFDIDSRSVQLILASLPEAAEYNEYEKLFKINDLRVLHLISNNPKARRFKAYNNLIPPECGRTLKEQALNPDSARYPMFRLFFNKENNNYWQYLVENPNAYSFKEFRRLFKKEDLLVKIADKPMAAFFKEFNLLFYKNNEFIQSKLATNPMAIFNKNFKSLFKENSRHIRQEVAQNIFSILLNDYKELFKDKNPYVLRSVASNKYAVIHMQEYQELFKKYNYNIIRGITCNLNAYIFPEFRKFFFYFYEDVAYLLASNPRAIIFEEFKYFFITKNKILKRMMGLNPLIFNLEESKILFLEDDNKLKEVLAMSERAARLEEFKILFAENNYLILNNLLKNKAAKKFEEYYHLIYLNKNKQDMIDHENAKSRLGDSSVIYGETSKGSEYENEDKKENENEGEKEIEKEIEGLTEVNKKNARALTEIEELNLLLFDNKIRRMISLEENIEKELRDLVKNMNIGTKMITIFFDDIDLNVRIALASNNKAAELDQYRKLFFDENWLVRRSVASNLKATNFDEYISLFSDEELMVRIMAASNRNAPRFDEYEQLISDKNWLVRYVVAQNVNATRFKSFSKLLKDEFWLVKCAALRNERAADFKEFKELFKDPNWLIRLALSQTKQALNFKAYSLLLEDKNMIVKNSAIKMKYFKGNL
ncbi:MAG: HEAT repeat domain-containing protein [Promethearchaeota archaeon]